MSKASCASANVGIVEVPMSAAKCSRHVYAGTPTVVAKSSAEILSFGCCDLACLASRQLPSDPCRTNDELRPAITSHWLTSAGSLQLEELG
jgi:hypothetical protein